MTDRISDTVFYNTESQFFAGIMQYMGVWAISHNGFILRIDTEKPHRGVPLAYHQHGSIITAVYGRAIPIPVIRKYLLEHTGC